MRYSREMRFARAPILVVVFLVACSPTEPSPVRIPTAIADLTLCEADPTITPVEYPHARHLDASVMGRAMACVDCHHDVADDPTAVPRRCEACHPHETDPHDDTMPPDI